MPPRSEAQRRAMAAAMHGHSTLGIPKSVGREFIEADRGGKLPKRAKRREKRRRTLAEMDMDEFVAHRKRGGT